MAARATTLLPLLPRRRQARGGEGGRRPDEGETRGRTGDASATYRPNRCTRRYVRAGDGQECPSYLAEFDGRTFTTLARFAKLVDWTACLILLLVFT
jgi:hypothetical protein